jgi:hypothetical protein
VSGTLKKKKKERGDPHNFKTLNLEIFFFQEVCFIQERSRHFEELVCRLGVPFSSPPRRPTERKVRAFESGTELPTRARGYPGSSALSPVGTAANRRLLFVEGERHPLERCKSVCSKWPQKRCRRVLSVRARVGYRGTADPSKMTR